MLQINKSLFSLMATNNGFFKSEKQSAFLLKFADTHLADDTYIFTIVPELKGCKFIYYVYADNQGITKAIKSYNNNAKSVKNKDQITFERLNDADYAIKQQDDLNAKNAKKQAYIEHLKQSIDDLNAYHLPKLNENLDIALQQKVEVMKIIDKIDVNDREFTINIFNEKIEKCKIELSKHHEHIASLQAEIDAM